MKILISKIHPPAAPPHAIERPRLLDRIREKPWDVVLLQAPAGYGKSVLALQVLESERKQTAWLYLEPEDADIRRFCLYVASALARVAPGLKNTELVDSPQSDSFKATQWVEDLIFYLQEFPTPTIRLILDNFESVGDEPEITKLIEQLVRRQTGKLSLLVTTRRTVKFRLRKLTTEGRALMLGSDDLAFSMSELKQAVEARGQAVTEKKLEELWNKSEGWCVYLALKGLDERPVSSSDDPAMIEYLAEEVLEKLPQELLGFLRTTSVLEEISPESAAAAGVDPVLLPGQFQALAECGVPHLRLEQESAVRLHPTVREIFLHDLQERISKAGLDELAGKVVGHYLEQDRYEPAARLLIQLEQFDLFLEFLHSNLNELARLNLLRRLEGWLDEFPREYRSTPKYVLCLVRHYKYIGDNRKLLDMLAEKQLDDGLAADSPVGMELLAAEIYARTSVGEEFNYEESLKRWQEVESKCDRKTRIEVENALYFAALYQLRLSESIRHAEKVYELHEGDSPILRAAAKNNITVVMHEMSRSHEALEIEEESIPIFKREGGLAQHSLNLIGIANTYKDLGRFGESLKAIDDGLDLAEKTGSLRLHVLPHAIRIRGECYWHLGRKREALAELREAFELFRDSNYFEGLATGVLVNHWSAIAGEPQEVVSEGEFAKVFPICEARVRFLIHKSRKAADSGNEKLALGLIREAREMGREMPAWVATTLFTEAWACRRSGQREAALELIWEGLEILGQIRRPLYMMADPILTAWVVSESVAANRQTETALSLVMGESVIDLHDAYRQALQDPHISSDGKQRVVKSAAQLTVRGLDEIIQQLPGVDAKSRQAYARMSSEAPLPPVRALLFGSFGVSAGGRDVRFARRAAKRAFQLLLLHHPEPVHEEKLIDALWPESDLKQGKRNLQTSINELRNSLDPHHRPQGNTYIRFADDHYRLTLPEGSYVDYFEFRDRVPELASARKLEAAGSEGRAILEKLLSLHHTELLAEEPYEEFVTEPRERARSSMLEGTITLARVLLVDDPADAARVLGRGLQIDPFWAEGIAMLMECLHRQKRTLAALRYYREYQDRLDRELGLQPDQQLQGLYRELTTSG